MNWKSFQSWSVVFLLFCMVVLQGIQMIGGIQADSECALKIEEIAPQVAAQSEIYNNLFEEYEAVAYGPSVDRIAEQQLIATETQLLALQVMASQNSVLVDLISTCK